MRAKAATPPVSGDERLWNVLLRTGGIFAVLLLGWQVADYFVDAAHPAMRKNDLISALGSVAMLTIVVVIAARRSQLKRSASQPVANARPSGAKRVKATNPVKRGSRPSRRKRRA